MIDDLLTMSEIIQCVADMRTQDVKAIHEFGKFVPAFAAFETVSYTHLDVYKRQNRYYGFTAQQTLDLVQTLYEKKLLTYPRTDSQFITDDMEDKMCIRDRCRNGLLHMTTANACR